MAVPTDAQVNKVAANHIQEINSGGERRHPDPVDARLAMVATWLNPGGDWRPYPASVKLDRVPWSDES